MCNRQCFRLIFCSDELLWEYANILDMSSANLFFLFRPGRQHPFHLVAAPQTTQPQGSAVVAADINMTADRIAVRSDSGTHLFTLCSRNGTRLLLSTRFPTERSREDGA